MIFGLTFTIGSLFFLIILFIVYFSKQRFLQIRNKVYRYMLMVVLILLVTELLSSFLIVYYDNLFINLLVLRIHWATGLIWFSFLYYYSMIFINDIEAENLWQIINYNKKTKIISMIFLVASIIYFFIPFDVPDKINTSYMPGLASYYVFTFCAACVLLVALHILRNNKKTNVRQRIAVWIMLVELAIVFLFQIIYPTVAISAIGVTVQMFFLYFNIENPDLKTIKDIETAKDDIERSSKAKTDFLSNMSHEIRSPMNAIVGFSQTLLNEPDFNEENVRADIKHIYSSSNSLLDIINNILDISKIESGKETLNEKAYSLGSIVMELTSIIESRLGDKPIKFIVEFDENIPSKLYGDSTKIFQVLLNILTNSVKYTEVGKIKLTVTGRRNNNYEKLTFRISDTGYGIKKEDHNKLFEKFSRLESATQNEVEGTGLGLVITKKYLDLMHGKIWFESEWEVGTTFYVEIEQRIINETKIGDIKEPIRADEKLKFLDCSNYSILIVDDNKLNLKVATRILSKYNFKIDTASSGEECVYKVKEGNHYDMIFLDHMMPGIDGIKALHIIKKLEDYDVPPVVALTANAITGMKEMYLSEGFDEYLSKPINISELNKIINKYFDK